MTKQIKSTPCCHALDYGQVIEAESCNRPRVRVDPDYPSGVVEG